LFNVTGTSEHIGVVAAENHLSDQLICAPFLTGKRLLYGVTSCGGGSLDWYQTVFGGEFRDLLAEAERVTEGAGGLFFLPYLEGERAPIWDPHASAAFIGIRLSDRQGHFVRAVLEGVAFSLCQILDLVVRQYPGARAPIVVSGGAARATLWNQIKASVLAREVVVPSNIHAGIMGAALLATVGAGLHPDPESAARVLVKMGEFYSPEPAASRRYQELYAVYSDLYPTLAAVLSRIYQFRQEDRKELCPTSRQ
jgi:sugar (pentulose or hexulose) kinase